MENRDNSKEKTVEYLVEPGDPEFRINPFLDDLNAKEYESQMSSMSFGNSGYRITLAIDRELSSEDLNTLSGAGCLVYKRVR